GTGSVGSVNALVPSSISVNVTGVAGTSAVGTTAYRFAYNVAGVSGSGAIGTVSISTGVIQNVTGVSATGSVGSPFVWSKIVPIQNPDWTPVSPANDAQWKKIAS
ncbi:MAG: hypothetical protein HOI09_05220, partial [Porticoccaceae bacterium]|nr:hypothetical protein [Porticoccaceae bacterium]